MNSPEIKVTVPSPIGPMYPLTGIIISTCVIDAGLFFGTLMDLVELGWAAGIATALTTAAVVTTKKLGLREAETDTNEVNRILRNHFQSDVTVEKARHKKALWPKYSVSDTNGGSFVISTEFNEERAKSSEGYDGTITVTHKPSDLGLKDFDQMLVAMGTNPDIKAISARIAEVSETEKQAQKSVSQKKMERNSLDALERFHKKNANAKVR